MKIYLVTVEDVITSMTFLDEKREQVKLLNQESIDQFNKFNERLIEYKRILESKLVVDDSVKQKAYSDYQKDMQSTENTIQALKMKAGELTNSINQISQSHFDAAINEWTKTLSAEEEYMIFPTESLIGFNTLATSGTDVTESVKTFVKAPVTEEIELN